MTDPAAPPESELEEAQRAALECWCETALGSLSLNPEAYGVRARGVLAALEDLSGNDVLWVLAAVLGTTIADAPSHRRRAMLVAFHALVEYSLTQAETVKAAAFFHSDEEGHA